ncbi:MAG: CpsD/CapB family tyrosine-protein kinase [Terracidiphilus sp.]
MSQIFDALQRSETERNGKDPAVPSATELLPRTESFAADSPMDRPRNSWTATAVAEPGLDAAELTQGPLPGLSVNLFTAKSVKPVEAQSEGFKQCEVLSISPSLESHLVCLPDSESHANEAFHLLGVRLRHLRRQRPLKKVLITSTIPQEGKSMVAGNLACTLALHTDQKVLLLEGDIRRPTQSKVFGIPRRPGICEWLNGEQSLVKSVYRLEGAGIWILPAGNGTGNSLEMLQSGAATPMMEQLTNWFDWVIIDSPPVLPLADTSVWTNLADGILLVTRQGITHKRHLKRGLDAVGPQKLIGALLNSAKNAEAADYYYRPNNRLPNDDAES